MKLVTDISRQLAAKLNSFENRVGIERLCHHVDSEFSLDTITQAIENYRIIIRNNQWYFPATPEDSLIRFLSNWSSVHNQYLDLAIHIFDLLILNKTPAPQPNTILFDKVITSETMRGWVGKRSLSGLDALLERRISRIEQLFNGCPENVIDLVIDHLGVSGKQEMCSAEMEVICLFENYHKTVGCPLEISCIDEADKLSNGSVRQLLRGFTKYSIADFNKKYSSLRHGLGKPKNHPTLDRVQIFNEASSLLKGVAQQEEFQNILSELRVLNAINLNTEVKYSFKGWAGLMHGYVFSTVENTTNINTDVYSMRSLLTKQTAKTS